MRKDKAAAEQRRLHSLLVFERPLWAAGHTLIAGVDEVGAGPLAGPVVAAAVILPVECTLPGVNDSKKVSPGRRIELDQHIRAHAVALAIGSCSPSEIDTLNIYRATLLAMRRAVVGLALAPHHVLVDARTIPSLAIPQTPIVGGDGKSHSVAAASIVAKVFRDRLMAELDALHPGYGLAQHKGYGTAAHMKAVRLLGPSPVHRKSFLRFLA